MIMGNEPTSRRTIVILLDQNDDVNYLDYVYLVRPEHSLMTLDYWYWCHYAYQLYLNSR